MSDNKGIAAFMWACKDGHKKYCFFIIQMQISIDFNADFTQFLKYCTIWFNVLTSIRIACKLKLLFLKCIKILKSSLQQSTKILSKSSTQGENESNEAENRFVIKLKIIRNCRKLH